MAPNWAAPVVALGDFFRSQGRAKDALVAYGRAAELTSNDAAIFIKRGNLLSEARDFDGAVEDYERAAQLQPGLASAVLEPRQCSRRTGPVGGSPSGV